MKVSKIAKKLEKNNDLHREIAVAIHRQLPDILYFNFQPMLEICVDFNVMIAYTKNSRVQVKIDDVVLPIVEKYRKYLNIPEFFIFCHILYAYCDEN